MAKPASKTKKTIQAKLGSLAKAGTKGKKRLASLKNIAPPISNKQKKSQGSSINATNLAAATHDNDTDSIVDQDDDDDDVVLAGIPNHSFLSLQALQGDILDNDDNKEECPAPRLAAARHKNPCCRRREYKAMRRWRPPRALGL